MFKRICNFLTRHTQHDSKIGRWAGSKRLKSIKKKGAVLNQYAPLFFNRFSAAFNRAHRPIFESCWVYILASSPAFSNSTTSNISEIIQQIPESDRKDLEHFFRLLFKEELFGYTLFGEKPISSADFAPPIYDIQHYRLRIIFNKGWEAWQRNEHLLSQKYFSLKREEDELTRSTHFYIINKAATLQAITNYIDNFKNELGNKKPPEQLLEQLCDPKDRVNNVLKSQFLWGIFFGFGKDSARIFQREEEILKILFARMLPPFSQKNKSFESLDQSAKQAISFLFAHKRYNFAKDTSAPLDIENAIRELTNISENRNYFELFSHEPILEQFSSPDFIIWDNHEETRQLQETYEKTKSLLRVAYKSGHFLEATLKQWISPKNDR